MWNIVAKDKIPSKNTDYKILNTIKVAKIGQIHKERRKKPQQSARLLWSKAIEVLWEMSGFNLEQEIPDGFKLDSEKEKSLNIILLILLATGA